MTIRIMTIEDYERIYALWDGTPGVGLVDYDDSREGIARYLDRNPDTSFVAEDAGRIIGSVLAGHDGRRGFIYHMTVAQDMRRQGVGEALTDAVRLALSGKGILKAALVAKANNEPGNAFWERQGFTTRPDLTYRNSFIMNPEQGDGEKNGK